MLRLPLVRRRVWRRRLANRRASPATAAREGDDGAGGDHPEAGAP
jgi:hypothetical protein